MPEDDEFISIIQIAEELGKHKQSIFKVIDKLRIQKTKMKSEYAKGQESSYISRSDQERVRQYVMENLEKSESDSLKESLRGFFYMIALEPKLDPLRIKLGFTFNLNERIRDHRCSAPYAEIVKTWSSKPTWERVAIDLISKNSIQIHTEVFLLKIEMDLAVENLSKFFNFMNEN